MDKILCVLRYILCTLGAAALLYTFSYPDAVMPPNPIMEDMDGFSLYKLKPIIWVLPVLMMELVAAVGKRRNLVWFSALLTVLVGALLAYPVLAAHRPEFVEPTFSYQGGMLSTGLGYYAVFVGISVVIRLVLVAYICPAEDFEDQLEIGFVSASELDPSKARTLKEIAAEGRGKAPKFQFKPGDARMALRWRLIMKRMMLRSRIANGAVAAAVLVVLLWFLCYPQPTAEEAWERDKQLMLEHRTNAHGQILATNAAVHAAARAMKRISDEESLAGMSRAEAEQWLGVDKVPDAYRTWLRDERDIELASTNSMYENRTRFLTVTNGRQICVLYIRTNEADQSIIICELQDAGWDAVADENRRLIGNDWGALYN